MKIIIGIALIVIAALWGGLLIFFNVRASYEYEAAIGSYWNLADKSSTIPQKSAYMDKFVQALEAQGLNGQHNAIIYPTLDNAFDTNMEALRSLQGRLREIQTMDVTSFQYQTAIQQITAQEQGEAHAMLDVFAGVWLKARHFWLWGWPRDIHVFVILTTGITGIAIVIWQLLEI